MGGVRISLQGEQGSGRVKHRGIWLALIPCFFASLLFGAFSNGSYHDDDLTHFLMARWVRWFPGYLVHIWGRPGLTIPLAATAWIGDQSTGWHAARVLSSVATAAGALAAAHIAMQLGVRRAWLVVAACYAQPLSAALSFTTLTENWMGMYLSVALLLLLRGRQVAASAIFSLTLVTRHEALVLLLIWWIAMLLNKPARRGRWTAIGCSLWAPVAHNLAFYAVFQDWPVAIFFAPRGSTEYPATGLLAYFPQALLAVSPVVAGLALFGGRELFRRGSWLLPAMTGTYFVTQVLIKAMGVFASGGYGRFMVAVTPLVAVLAIVALEERFDRSGRIWPWMAGIWIIGWGAIEAETSAGRILAGRSELLWIIRIVVFAAIGLIAAASHKRVERIVAGASTALVIIQLAIVVRPLRVLDEQKACIRVVQWLRDQNLDQQPLFITHPWLVHEMDLAEDPRAHKGPALLASMPVGTICVWDSKYSGSDFHKLALQGLMADREHYSFLHSVDGGGTRLAVFRKIAATPDREEAEGTYPVDLTSRRRPVRGIFYVRCEGG